MKHLLRPILCGGVLAALLCTPSLAAGEGDFSLLSPFPTRPRC